MKNLIVAFLLISGCALTAAAQDKIEQYCQMSVFGRSDKYTAYINYGGGTAIKSVEEKLKFKSVAESLNYLGTDGWKLVSSKMPYNIGEDWTFIFKKEVDKKLISSAHLKQ